MDPLRNGPRLPAYARVVEVSELTQGADARTDRVPSGAGSAASLTDAGIMKSARGRTTATAR
jgi:hypothetical protein